MNEDIKKFENKKSRTREEIFKLEKRNNKRTVYMHWGFTILLSIIYCWSINVGSRFVDYVFGIIGFNIVCFSLARTMKLSKKSFGYSESVLWIAIVFTSCVIFFNLVDSLAS